MARAKATHTPYEALGLVLLGAGTVLFLALISYTPADVPAWFPLSTVSKATRGTSNFIGVFGAMLACTFYTLLGAASYLVAAVTFGYGGAKLLSPWFPLRSRWLWCAIFVLSGACLAAISPWSLIDADKLRLASEGGLLGHWLGGQILRKVLGPVGSVIILLSLYGTSLVLLTGIQIGEVIHTIFELPGRAVEKLDDWQHVRAARRERRLAERERMLKQREKERAQRKPDPVEKPERTPKARATSPRNEPAPEPDSVDEPELPPEPPRPEPKIFDSTAPQAPRRKESKPDKLTPMSPYPCENYEMPSLDLLDAMDMADRQTTDPEELRSVQMMVIDTLEQFGITVAPGDITRGPTITRYEVYPAKGVRVDRIVSLERDIARATRAERINILAPIPGKDTVGIEIANSKKQKVTLRELLESD
ncbi:MAG: DNA translocase FtsK 4TM domain-containing protein, partial [Chthoniobacteraceae bacterium]